MSDFTPVDEADLWARVRELNRVPKWQCIERDRTVRRELEIIASLKMIAALDAPAVRRRGR